MASITIDLSFDGYWRAVNKASIPSSGGVYCVYACTYDSSAQTVSIRRLLYIGEAANVRDRIDGHERWHDWEAYLRAGEVLCFNCAQISARNRQRAEAALIYHHQPPANNEYKSNFPFDRTTVNVKGRAAKLSRSFTVSGWARKSA